jgi:hypothetical protein
MLLDHLPSIYDRAFHRAFETMMIEKNLGSRRAKRKSRHSKSTSMFSLNTGNEGSSKQQTEEEEEIELKTFSAQDPPKSV